MKTAQRLTGACPQFTWDDTNWLAMPNAADLKKSLAVSGWGFDFQLVLFATVDQFAQNGYATADTLVEAMLQTPMQYLGEDFKIEGVKILTGGPTAGRPTGERDPTCALRTTSPS